MADNLNIEDAIFRLRSYDTIAEDAAKQNGVDPTVIKAMIRQESGFNPTAQSSKGAMGLMQLMPQTAAELGVKDPMDPEQNIRAGTKYFAQLMKRYKGDTSKALAAYNAGMGNVDSGKASGFKETRDYVSRITKDAASQQTEVPSIPVTPLGIAPETAKPSADDDIEAKIAALRTAGLPQPTTKVTKAPAPTQVPEGLIARFKAHPLDTIADELPTIGGAVGGAIGGVTGAAAGGVGAVPGGLGGAALGGAAGEAFKELYNRFLGDASKAPQTSGEAAKNIGLQSGLQAGTELVGQGIGKALGLGGKYLIKRAFQPSAEALAKTPTLITDIAREGINPNAAGIATMEGRTNAARQVAEHLVDQAGQPRILPNGVKVTPNIKTRDIVDALFNNPYGHDSALDNVQALANQGPGRKRLINYAVGVLDDNPDRISFNRALEMRRAEGSAASKVFEGAVENPSLEQQLHAGIEAGARNALEQRVKGFAEANDVTQNKLRVLQAVQDIVKQREAQTGGSLPSMLRHMIPAGVLFPVTGPLGSLATYAGTEALTNPTVEATLGRGLLSAAKGGGFIADTLRAGEVAGKESSNTRAAKRVNKTKVDSLYQRYQQEGQSQE